MRQGKLPWPLQATRGGLGTTHRCCHAMQEEGGHLPGAGAGQAKLLEHTVGGRFFKETIRAPLCVCARVCVRVCVYRGPFKIKGGQEDLTERRHLRQESGANHGSVLEKNVPGAEVPGGSVPGKCGWCGWRGGRQRLEERAQGPLGRMQGEPPECAQRGARYGLALREHAGRGGRGARREATAIIRDILAASAKVGRESQGPRGRGAASRPQEPTSPGETAGARTLFPQTSCPPVMGLKGRWEGQG